MSTTFSASGKAPPPSLHRFSLKDYVRMSRHGLLSKDDRVELLDGLVVKKMNRGPRHVTVAHRIFATLMERLPAGWHPRKEDPIELPGGPMAGAPSAPEPDVTVVRGPFGTYGARHPVPDEVAPAVEVAGDARMLAKDRKGLARLAWNRIPVAWIVNLPRDTIEVYTNPTGPCELPEYQARIVLKPGDPITVPLAGAPAVALDVRQLLA